MSQCWSEGALRAHLDHELSPQEAQLVAAHLAECAECAGISENLAERGARVAVWMNALAEPEIALYTAPDIFPDRPVPTPRRAIARRRWIGLTAAIAAGLAVAAILLPKHEDVVIPLPGPLVLTPPAVVAAESAPVVVSPRTIRRPRARLRTVNNDFLALDDEPIETGVIMRVGVEPGNVQADIVFGQDGRAHAIRLVGAKN